MRAEQSRERSRSVNHIKKQQRGLNIAAERARSVCVPMHPPPLLLLLLSLSLQIGFAGRPALLFRSR
jgi:hypothetical protein